MFIRAQLPPDRRPTRGLRGLAGLRADAPSEARGAGGERAGRPRGGWRSGGAVAVAGDLVGLWQAGDLAGYGQHRKNKRGCGYEKPATRRPPVICASWGT